MSYAPTYELNFNIFNTLKDAVCDAINKYCSTKEKSSEQKQLKELAILNDFFISLYKIGNEIFIDVASCPDLPNSAEIANINKAINNFDISIKNFKTLLGILEHIKDFDIYKNVEKLYYQTIAIRQIMINRIDPSFEIFGAIDRDYLKSCEFDIVEYAKSVLDFQDSITAALEEVEDMEKHPEKYPTYETIEDLKRALEA